MHGSIILTFLGRRGAQVIFMCIFRNNPLYIRLTIYDLFVVVCLFVQPKASGCVCVTCSWHQGSQEKSKLIQSDAPTIKLLQ